MGTVMSSHGVFTTDDSGKITRFEPYPEADPIYRTFVKLDLPKSHTGTVDILDCGIHTRDGRHDPPVRR